MKVVDLVAEMDVQWVAGLERGWVASKVSVMAGEKAGGLDGRLDGQMVVGTGIHSAVAMVYSMGGLMDVSLVVWLAEHSAMSSAAYSALTMDALMAICWAGS